MTNGQKPADSGKTEDNPAGNDDGHAYYLMKLYAFVIVLVLIIGVGLAYFTQNFCFVPFGVVIMGIVAFFGVLRISRALTGTDEGEMRKAITVAILVVYLGLLPTLAFQGILQFEVTGNTTATAASDVTILNQTVNQTVVQVTPKDVSLYETVVTSFTALVAAVLLFYFGSGPLDSYYNFLKAKAEGPSDVPPATITPEQAPVEQVPAEEPVVEAVDPTETEKETTVLRYDSDGNCVEKTVTIERIKKVE